MALRRRAAPLLLVAALGLAACSSDPSPDAAPAASPAPSPAGVGVPDGGATGLYRGYQNARFGFLVEVPRDFVEQEAPTNDDGRTFRSPDGHATPLAYGSNDVDEQTPQQVLDATVQDLRDDGIALTYQRLVGDVATASGTKGADVVFVRTVDTGPTLQTFRWTYPIADADRFRAAVQHSAATFRPGQG
ncbi:MAG: hypothetical protein JWM64_220 [Frankiales bacterium]|nr:hypothetical protein [Frankiales bacterium]